MVTAWMDSSCELSPIPGWVIWMVVFGTHSEGSDCEKDTAMNSAPGAVLQAAGHSDLRAQLP